MYNDKLVYKVVIWAFFGISLWREKVALNVYMKHKSCSNGTSHFNQLIIQLIFWSFVVHFFLLKTFIQHIIGFWETTWDANDIIFMFH